MKVCYDCGRDLGEDDWYRVIREEPHLVDEPVEEDGPIGGTYLILPVSVWVCRDEVGCKRRANACPKEKTDAT
jgi:hypothetical protein